VVNGEIETDPSALDRYTAQFPINRLSPSQPALADLRAFGIEYGTGDQFTHIPVATREFSKRMAELRISHRFEVYQGDHRKRVAHRLESIILPYVAGALDRSK
jgi:hypothetical protein